MVATTKVAGSSNPSPARGAKPGERRGGRKKGTPNKISADLRTMINGALNKVGGEKYLQRQANKNPVAFLTLLGKTLPKELTGLDGKDLIPPLPGSIRVTVVAAAPEEKK